MSNIPNISRFGVVSAVQQEGVPVTPRGNLSFDGSAFAITDDATNDTTHITATVEASQTVAASSSTFAAGQVAMTSSGDVVLAVTAKQGVSILPAGIAITAGAPNDTIVMVTQGLVPPGVVSLGNGYACKVGIDALGNPVRVTDSACVSGLKYVGVCDVNGAIFVQPELAKYITPTDYGIIGDGVTDNAAAHAAMLAALNVFGQQQNKLEYPAGKYLFSKTIGPWPFDMRIMGHGTSDYEGRGGDSGSNAPLPGGTTFVFSGTGVGVQLGHYLDSNSRNGTIFEGFEIAGTNEGGNADVVTMSGSPSITVNGTARTYTRSTGSFISDGFAVGQTVYWADTFVNYQNSYRHTIVALTATVMTVSSTDMLQPVTETLASGGACYANLYNDVGIECVGDVGVLVRDIRIGGFKNKLSFDGCEACLALNMHFDGVQDGTHGYPLTDQTEDRGADSAFDYRVGSFYFTSGTSGNKNTLQQANFNGASNGWYVAGDGVDNVIRDCAFECGKNFGQVGNCFGLRIQDCSGEGSTVSTIKSIGTVYNLTLDNVTGTTDVPLLDVVGVIYGCRLTGNDCRLMTVPPVSNAANVIALTCTGNLPPGGSGSSVAGQMLDVDPASAGIVESCLDGSGGVGVNCRPNTLAGVDVLGVIGARHSSKAVSNGLNSNVSISPTLTSFLRITGPTGAFALGGFVGGTDGAELTILNTTAQAMTITHEDASSTAANRITTLTGADVVLPARTSSARFLYDGVTSRWIYLDAPASASTSPDVGELLSQTRVQYWSGSLGTISGETPGLNCLLSIGNSNVQPQDATTLLGSSSRGFAYSGSGGPVWLGSYLITSNDTGAVLRGNAAGIGGFTLTTRFGIDFVDPSPTVYAFVGMLDMTQVSTATNIDWTTQTTVQAVGAGFTLTASGGAFTGNWKIISCDGAAVTVADSGIPIVTGNLIELELVATPDASSIAWTLNDLTANTTASGTITTHLPAKTLPLAWQSGMTVHSGGGGGSGSVWSTVRYTLESSY
jgi:hypothetical protein